MGFPIKINPKSVLEQVPQLKKAIFLDTVDSTNAEALRQVKPSQPTPALWIAESQGAGRGRLQRHWDSPAGLGLYLSLLLHPDLMSEKLPLLSLAGGLALAKPLKKAGWKPCLKWPNDVLLPSSTSDKKVAGILCEMKLGEQKRPWVVVGVGLNLFQKQEDFSPELSDQASSLAIEAEMDQTILPEDILISWLQTFFFELNRLEVKGAEPLIEEWEKHSSMLGKNIRLKDISGTQENTVDGVMMGLSPQGHLRLQQEDGKIEEFAAGDVTIL